MRTQYIDTLIGTSTGTHSPATGINLVSNFYAAGTRVTQAAYGIANILQKSYFVMAFTLQLAVESECSFEGETLNTYLGNGPYATDVIYKGINFPITSDTLPGALSTLTSNFNQFVAQAHNDIETLAKPFLTYDGTTLEYWNPVQVISHAGLNLASDFMQNGCFPICYVKNVNNNGNLDYLAAECNYNGDWKILQLFIPTNNGTPGVTDISYFSDFGLIGDIDYQEISSFMKQSGTISSAGTCSSHYDNQCTSGFDDCYVGHASMQLQPTPVSSYGSAFTQGKPMGTPGLNQRFTFSTNVCYGGGSSPCTNDFYTVVFTPNGHLFQTDLHGQFCENKTAHDMKNTQVDLSAGGITETTQLSNNTLSFTDGNQVTNVTFGGPSNNAAGQDGNADPNWAEYGFGVNVTDAPQPTASPYPLCSEGPSSNPTDGSKVSLLPIYSYTNSGVETGTVTGATTITDSNNDTLTFASTYDSFIYNSNTWSRSTSSTTPPDGAESMQGFWQTGTGNNTQYLNIYCTN